MTTRLKCGDFVVPSGNVIRSDVAIVCLDHQTTGYSDIYTVRWLSDGHISNRRHEELTQVDAETATRIWCRTCIEFPTQEVVCHT